jgi:hypothetical protein
VCIALTDTFSLHLHPNCVIVGAVVVTLDNAIVSSDLISSCRLGFRSPFSPHNMIPVSGVYDMESRHKRPVEHSSDSPSTSSESGDHFWDTTTSATDTDTAGGLRSPKKRPRLQYRDHIESFQSDDSWRTENTATSALTEAAVEQGASQLRTSSSGQWVLRRNRSNISVSSTRTEGSDHDEATAVHSNRSPSFSSPASTPRSSRPASLIFVAENSSDAESSQHYQQQQEQPQPQPPPQHYQGDGDGLQEQMESLTSRVENWSLTNIRALRRNNVFEDSSAASTQRRQVRAAKRDVMRVLRRSNNSLSSSVMSSCSNVE